MRMYECHVCHGLCDPGELENGVCFDCRREDAERQERKSLEIRKEWNQFLQQGYRQQADGQMVMNYGR